MKKIKLSTKAVLSLGLSAVLFCMPAVGFALNGNYAVNVHAEDSKAQEAVSCGKHRADGSRHRAECRGRHGRKHGEYNRGKYGKRYGFRK